MHLTFFEKAEPVWPKDQAFTRNLTCGFWVSLKAANAAIFRVTASTTYRMFCGDRLIAYGPARTAKGYFRVDEIDLSDFLKNDSIFYLEVAGYNCNSYATLNQPSFLQAEAICDGCIAAYTSAKDGGFVARVLTERIRRVQRYSFQRPFLEAWRLTPQYASGYFCLPEGPFEKLETQPGGKLLPRRVALPEFCALPAVGIVATGRVTEREIPLRHYEDRSLTEISDILTGFPRDELEAKLSDDACRYEFSDFDFSVRDIAGAHDLCAGHFLTVGFEHNSAGFLSMRVKCTEQTRLVLFFDEMLKEHDVDCFRMGDCANIARYDLAPGEYWLLSMECYVLQYLKVIALSGQCEISDIAVVEYAASETGLPPCPVKKGSLAPIWDAAVRSYRQNAVDLPTDCPSRERAGWLCDSFFAARVAYTLTKTTTLEHNFLENYLLAGQLPTLPKGMFPMCYPADHDNGVFIPNWAMWLVLQLTEYASRGGKMDLISEFRAPVLSLFSYLDTFLNEDGLLEDLPSWVFVEWSHANDLTDGVNYPSNMLYAAAKQAAGQLYGESALCREADAMKKVILAQSFHGIFFQDHAVRRQGKLFCVHESTEVCQYYAFFFGLATPDSHPALWATLINDFGPERKGTGRHPEIAPSNAFMGNAMRIDLLLQNGLYAQAAREIEGYYSKMAALTGTLWEHDTPTASLSHGFAAYAVCWLKLLGEQNNWRQL